MIKRKISSLILLCSILFIISFQYIPVVKGLTESYTDPQNDVFKIDFETNNVEKVSSHDEIDIVNITLDGQYTNVTFAGNITGHDIECNIYFFEHYNKDNLIFEYGVHYSNFTGTGFNVIFVKYILSGDEYEYQFWNDTIGWTPSNISADIIGTSSDYVIEATIPDLALSIHESITWFVVSTYYLGSIGYLDCAPDSYCPIEETGINWNQIILFIVIAAFVGIGAFYFYKKRKPKKDSFPL
ncbi:MAG: hypothetical protein ACFE8M_08325 [Candidatus Hermodarchaeota archaeon]